MSLTARERNNPPPRRKSCQACVKAKRRCDSASPACLRCSQRRIPCQYPSRSSRTPSLPPQTPDLMQGLLAEDQFTAIAAGMETTFNELTGFDLPFDQDTLDLIHQPSMLAPPVEKEFDSIPQVIAARLQWSLDEIQKAPTLMVLETQTPWCHPLLYKDDMPRSIQDAHASCALYMAKNRVNAPVVFRSIEARVHDLLASPAPVTARDCLAHTHALLLYQIIRLFDGDIAARASAERILPALENSALALLNHVNFDIDTPGRELPLFPLAPTKTFWVEWIYQESARRTLLFTFFFMQAYRILSRTKGLTCDGQLGLCHSWTLSSYLWQAKTPMAFAEAWKNKKHFVITNARFGEVLEEAMADDVDTYGKIFITSLLGIEEAEGWFGSRGGKL